VPVHGGPWRSRFSALEAEERASRVARFDHTVREEGQCISRLQVEGALLVGLRGNDDAQRQAGLDRDFLAATVGRKVSRISQRDHAA
jgi:hypothetical protein